jgi:NADH dehydrogenase FAD-containing subunit
MLLIHLGREACNLLTENFKERGINLYLGKNLVAARPGMAVFEGNLEVPSDLICAAGNLEAPDILRGLSFSRTDGFIPVNNDLTCKAYSNIYVAGDATQFTGKTPVPKVATLAIDQGQIAAINIHAEAASAGADKVCFDPEQAIKDLYVLSDFGGIGVMAKNYKTVRYGAYIAAVKESIERYYLYTHRHGIAWHPAGLEKSA